MERADEAGCLLCVGELPVCGESRVTGVRALFFRDLQTVQLGIISRCIRSLMPPFTWVDGPLINAICLVDFVAAPHWVAASLTAFQLLLSSGLLTNG